MCDNLDDNFLLPFTHFQRSNQIQKIENLDTLQYLQQLNLSCNKLSSLEGVPERLGFLEVIDLTDNQVNERCYRITNYPIVSF